MLGLSQTSVSKVLHGRSFKAYKICLVQELSEDNFDSRLEFYKPMTRNIDNNTIRLNNIALPDKTTFMSNGNLYRHNCHYWADVNPH